MTFGQNVFREEGSEVVRQEALSGGFVRADRRVRDMMHTSVRY